MQRSMVALAAVLVAAGAGCDEPAASVSGVVILDGRPLEIGSGMRGTVVFRGQQGGAVATGNVASDGTYRIATGGSRELTPGIYLVSVNAVRIVPPSEGKIESTGQPVLPAVYADPAKSGLTCQVRPGKNTCNLELRSNAGPIDSAGEKPDDSPGPDSDAERAPMPPEPADAEAHGAAK